MFSLSARRHWDRPRYAPATRISLTFTALAAVCLLFADIEISTFDPWAETLRFLKGFVTPDPGNWTDVGGALLRTLAFAFVGVALGCTLGFGLALLFRYRFVRAGCAFVRAIHELFWALIFLQFFGLHPLTGVLAICIPYAG
ncbi:MAG: ABC transporter permease, partial [Gammaproteobacteria bacterium]